MLINKASVSKQEENKSHLAKKSISSYDIHQWTVVAIRNTNAVTGQLKNAIGIAMGRYYDLSIDLTQTPQTR